MCLAVPGRIVAKQGAQGTVAFDGVRQDCSLALVPEAEVGDYVIVHVGFALSRLDPEEAARTLELLREAADKTAAQGRP